MTTSQAVPSASAPVVPSPYRPRRRLGRGAKILLGIVVLLLLLALVALLLLRGSLPQTRGELELDALDRSVEVVRDDDGVPHIYAENDADLFTALGYVHAQDRMWQMEMNRRIAAGRLSEVFGEATLETDRFLRTLGLFRAAESSLDALQPETLAILEAYAAGVNAWIDEGNRLPPEFLILGVEPEDWAPADSLGWEKMMSWDLSKDWDLELLRWYLYRDLGQARAEQVLPGYPEDAPSTIEALEKGVGDALSTASEPGADPRESARIAAKAAGELVAFDDALRSRFGFRQIDVGSNGWVVSGDHTRSGLPILANDPHLSAQIPSVWYLAELHGDEFHVTGATLPGLPGVVVGRNEHVAWGLTNLNPDVQDLYLEQIDPEDPNRYRYMGRWEEMEIVEEEIEVKDRDDPVVWAARSTRHGPLLGDVLDAGPALALRWTALDPDDTTLEAFLGMNLASDWGSFQNAMRRWVTPSQNVVYADVEGNIGYFAPGRIPIRAEGDGTLPVPGWDGAYEWEGFIPFDELPRAFNPEAGFIVTANQRVVDEGYPYHLSSDWAPPYRAERIIERLQELVDEGRIEVDDMEELQADQRSNQARSLLEALRDLEGEDDRQRDAIELLKDWDGDMEVDSAAAALYNAWYVALGRAVLEDDLRGESFERMMKRRHPLLLEDLLDGQGDGEDEGGWCDDQGTPDTESCEDTALVALDSALDDLEARIGTKPENWRWGALHRTRYRHNPFSEVAALRAFFHREIENGGDPYTVNAASVDLQDLYAQPNVPSYRQIVDLDADVDDVFMQTTGQSGNVLSRHYDDLIERHRDVEYLEMRFDEDPPEGDELKLDP